MDALVRARGISRRLLSTRTPWRLLACASLAASVALGCEARQRSPASIEFRDGPCRESPGAVGAGGQGGDGGSGGGDGRPQRPEPVVPRLALAFDGDQLVVIDAATAAVLSTAAASPGAVVRDVVFDAPRGRALVFESDFDEQAGEVLAHPLVWPAGEAPALGAGEHVCWIDGRARLAVTPGAALLFEQAYGTRWRPVPGDGPPVSSLIAPRPASAWVSVDGEARVHALVYGSAVAGAPAPLELVSAPMAAAPGPLDAEGTALVAGTDPATARALDAPALGGVILVDVIDGVPAVRLLRDGAVSEAEPLLEAGVVARVESVVGMHGGRTIAVLASGPARVLVARLGQAGGVLSEARLDLAGEVRQESSFFSRDLLALGDARLLAATDAGVTALHVDVSGGVSLDVDAAFSGSALRGPLAALAPPPP